MLHDEMPLDSCLALWGVAATLKPMGRAGGPNAPASPDTTRTEWAGTVLRAEHAARISIGDNGMGRSSGQFRMGAAGMVHIVTFKVAEGFEPRAGDILEYPDRPLHRYVLAEPKPDGGAGIHFTVNKV